MRAPKGYGLKWPVRATGLKHSARRGDGRAASHHTAKSRYAIQAFPQMREGRAVRNEMAIYSYRIKDSRPKKRWSGGSNEMASSRYAVQPFPYGRKGRGRTHGMGSSRYMASAFPPIGPGNRGFQNKWPVFAMGPKCSTAVEVRAGNSAFSPSWKRTSGSAKLSAQLLLRGFSGLRERRRLGAVPVSMAASKKARTGAGAGPTSMAGRCQRVYMSPHSSWEMGCPILDGQSSLWGSRVPPEKARIGGRRLKWPVISFRVEFRRPKALGFSEANAESLSQ